jgi:hypothetical protein
MVDDLTKCPQCKTRTLKREGDELVCSSCNGRFPVPPEPPERKLYKRHRRYDNLQERHKYYEKHKQEIVDDLLSIGQVATREKWDISDSTIVGLKNRWLNAAQKAKVASIMPPKRPLGHDEAHNFYEKHKSEIIIDLLTFGRVGTRKKWNIKASSSLFTLESRWLTPAQKARVDSVDVKSLGHSHIELPQFPGFSNDWQPQVQLRWFDLYSKLIGRDSDHSGEMVDEQEQEQIVEALINLGTPKREAETAAATVLKNYPSAPLEEKLKFAIQIPANRY